MTSSPTIHLSRHHTQAFGNVMLLIQCDRNFELYIYSKTSYILIFQNNDKLTTKKPLYEKRDNSIAKFKQNWQYLASWLKSVAIQNWFRNVENPPKCYFKGFCMILRVIFTKCRTCNHKLPIIETGRWNNLNF